jgi:predicted nucleic acid-binding protein
MREILGTIRAVCTVEPDTLATHERGLAIHERYGFALYHSMIIASALIADGKALYAEDLQHRQVIDAQLRIVNPFSTV